MLLLAIHEFILFVNKLIQLFFCHREYLIESAKHEALEVLIGDAQNGRSVGLHIRVCIMKDKILTGLTDLVLVVCKLQILWLVK